MASTKEKIIGSLTTGNVKGETLNGKKSGKTAVAQFTNIMGNNDTSNASSGTTSAAIAAAANAGTQSASGTSNLDDAKQRLLDSLDYTYGRKQELSDQSYDKSISQTDNAMLSRGMQRSSYAQQVLANMAKQKIEAAGDIESEKIAAYNTGVNQLEQQEREQQNWEKNYALQQESLAQQKAESEWNKTYADRQIAISALQAAAAAGNKNVTDDLLARAGISRKDFEQWIAAAKTSSKSSGRGGTRSPSTQNPTDQNPADPTGLMNDLNGNYGGVSPNLGNVGNDISKKKKIKPTSNGISNGTTAIE